MRFVRIEQSTGLNSSPDTLTRDIALRGCGICCVASAVRTLTDHAPLPEDLHRTMIESDGYTERGAKHASLADLLEAHGLDAAAEACSRDEIIRRINREAFICSVKHRFPSEGAGGHLVLLHDVSGGKASFMDPSGWGRDTCELPTDQFFSSHTGRVISIRHG